jgi:hypothetical protein
VVEVETDLLDVEGFGTVDIGDGIPMTSGPISTIDPSR